MRQESAPAELFPDVPTCPVDLAEMLPTIMSTMEGTTMKLFALFWRKLGNTIVDIERYAADMREFPERPWHDIKASLNTPCPRCRHGIRLGERVCWLPASGGQKSIAFHWSCAPTWASLAETRKPELEAARRMVARCES